MLLEVITKESKMPLLLVMNRIAMHKTTKNRKRAPLHLSALTNRV